MFLQEWVVAFSLTFFYAVKIQEKMIGEEVEGLTHLILSNIISWDWKICLGTCYVSQNKLEIDQEILSIRPEKYLNLFPFLAILHLNYLEMSKPQEA